jgi:hypothetical protein
MRPRRECRSRARRDLDSLEALKTLGRVLSGIFARQAYGRAMDIFAVALIVVLFGACAAFLAGIERL